MSPDLSKKKCFVCNSSKSSKILMSSYENFRFDTLDKRYDIYCEDCNLLFKSKKIRNENKTEYWENLYQKEIENFETKEFDFDLKYNEIINDLKEVLNHENIINICEVGTFTGLLLSKLKKNFPQKNFFGIDPSIDSITFGKKKYKDLFLSDDFFETYSPDRKYDLVIFSSVIARIDISILFDKLKEITNNESKIVVIHNFLFEDDEKKLKFNSMSDQLCSGQYLEYYINKRSFIKFFEDNELYLERMSNLGSKGEHLYLMTFSRKIIDKKIDYKNFYNIPIDEVSNLYLRTNLKNIIKDINNEFLFYFPENKKKKFLVVLDFLKNSSGKNIIFFKNNQLLNIIFKKNVILFILKPNILEIFFLFFLKKENKIVVFLNSKKDIPCYLPDFLEKNDKKIFLNKLDILDINDFKVNLIKKIFRKQIFIYKIYLKLRKYI